MTGRKHQAVSPYRDRGGLSPGNSGIAGVKLDAVSDKDQDIQVFEPMADSSAHPDGRATAPLTASVREVRGMVSREGEK